MKFKQLAPAALALLLALPLRGQTIEYAAEKELEPLHEEWAEIFYRQPEDTQAEQFEKLLPRIHALVERYPKEAEPLVMEAILLCTYASVEFGFGALDKVERARELLIQSIDLDPRAMEASAYVTLGNLYYRLPGWPISYGDEDQARFYLEAALRLFPDTMDTNYFYGDYLLGQGEFAKALPYLEKADRATIRPHARLSDMRLKEELKRALKDAREHNEDRADFFSRLLPSLGEDKTAK